jgi:hypothetical protein
VYRDYSRRGVKFYFIYKSLAHPELAGDYVQPFTLDERIAHARQAGKQLGTHIPWLVDPMDNRLKHALGDRANSEFVIDPNGKIVRKRAWSNPAQLRRDLERLVGHVAHPTNEEDIHLNIGTPLRAPADRGVVPRLNRPRMLPLVLEPKIETGAKPFFAKLRAEVDAAVLRGEPGKLYLGFHLDPVYEAHWNNLTPPLKFKLDLPDEVKLSRSGGEAPKIDFAADADPREFLLDVESWPGDVPVRLTVTYAACTADECHVVRQEYLVHRRRDKDGGLARGAGAGFWEPDDFVRQMLLGDADGDHKLNRSETSGLLRANFDRFDINRDGLLDANELREAARWLNEHHSPATGSR